MNKLLAFILLFSHINFSMFIAQVDEVDVYNKQGQLEDINTLAEYIDYAINGNTHQGPSKDEDDDNARYFHVSKPDNYYFNQLIVVIKNTGVASDQSEGYPPYVQKKTGNVFFDKQSPPPKGNPFSTLFIA